MKQQPPLPEEYFPKLFPRPTGANGWEEFIRAGDLLRQNPAVWPRGVEAAPLPRLRTALEARPVREALALVRAGLGKPAALPKLDFGPWSMDVRMSTTHFRWLASLMSASIRVHFTDGRLVAACDAIHDGLRLADVPAPADLVGGQVARIGQRFVVDRTARHVEAIPARECDRLVVILRRRLADVGRFETAIRCYWEGVSSSVKEALTGPERALPDDLPSDSYDLDLARMHAELLALRANPSAARAFTAQMSQAVGRSVRYDLQRYAEPWRDLLPPADPQPGSLVDRLVTSWRQIGNHPDGFAEIRTKERLLAVRVLVRRFVWENDRLPKDLAELKAPDLTFDPFTGGTLKYEPSGPGAYRLESAGPRARDENGGFQGRSRTPVTIWPDTKDP